jgi:hypothetical protein
LTPRAGGAPINRLVQSERMIATNNISTQPGEDAGATFWTSVAVVEGRYSAPRAKVVTSDLSATPNPLIAHKTKNLLSPFSNIRAISRKLCMGLSLVIGVSPVAPACQRLVQSGFYEVARRAARAA